VSLTAVVTNYNYGRYLEQCLASCMRCADEVLLYDDASTDDSLRIAARFRTVRTTVAPANTGSPVWGSTQSIRDCRTTHLVWVDADNFMVRRPAEGPADYTFHTLMGVHEDGSFRRWYKKHRRPCTYPEVVDAFLARPELMPIPWGGVWRMDFLRGREWLDFECAATAPDWRTSIEWLRDRPTLAYSRQPFLAIRAHPGRMSVNPERLALCKAEAAALAAAW